MADEQTTAAADPQKTSLDETMEFLSRETQAEANPPTSEPELKPDVNAPSSNTDDEEDPNEILRDYKLLADITVEVLDMGANIGCQLISGIANEKAFEVSEAKKNKIKEPLAKIFKLHKVETNPYIIIVFLVLITYAPMFMKAIGIRKRKQEAEKLTQTGPPQAPPRYPPGAPTKEEGERRRKEKEKYERDMEAYVSSIKMAA